MITVYCIHCDAPDERPDWATNMPYCYSCWLGMRFMARKPASVLFSILLDVVDEATLFHLHHLFDEHLTEGSMACE